MAEGELGEGWAEGFPVRSGLERHLTGRRAQISTDQASQDPATDGHALSLAVWAQEPVHMRALGRAE
jgi:hypothetical protein